MEMGQRTPSRVMEMGEKKRKLHEALLERLYPQSSSKSQEDELEDEPVVDVRDGLDLSLISDFDDSDEGDSSTSCDEDDCSSAQKKLTRAQRKRLRKKKLKEVSSRRRKIIGPVLPSSTNDDCGSGDVREDYQVPNLGVVDAGIDKPGVASPSTFQTKLKHRRLAKRLGRSNKVNCSNEEKEDSSTTTIQVRTSCGSDGTKPL